MELSGDLIIGILAGIVMGILIGGVLSYFIQRQSTKQVNQNMKNSFSALSTKVLRESNKSFLQLANEKLSSQTKQHTSELDTKKQLIDQHLEQMSSKLEKVTTLVS